MHGVTSRDSVHKSRTQTREELTPLAGRIRSRVARESSLFKDENEERLRKKFDFCNSVSFCYVALQHTTDAICLNKNARVRVREIFIRLCATQEDAPRRSQTGELLRHIVVFLLYRTTGLCIESNFTKIFLAI